MCLVGACIPCEVNMLLSYRPGEAKPPEQANERNGVGGQTIMTDRGPVRVDLARGRYGSFEPSDVFLCKNMFNECRCPAFMMENPQGQDLYGVITLTIFYWVCRASLYL